MSEDRKAELAKRLDRDLKMCGFRISAGQRKEISKVCARIAAEELASEWLPIETAPKDGRQIEVGDPCFHEGMRCWVSLELVHFDKKADRWVFENDGGEPELCPSNIDAYGFWRDVGSPPEKAND